MNIKASKQIEDPAHRTVASQLDKDIREAAAQLVGHDNIDDEPFTRFILLCAARAEFEDEDAVGSDPELKWVEVAKDALGKAAKGQKKDGHYPLPVLLSWESPTVIEEKRELYQKMAANLVIANTGESPELHAGIEFAGQVAQGMVQIRYV